jgi:hypothetical protein
MVFLKECTCCISLLQCTTCPMYIFDSKGRSGIEEEVGSALHAVRIRRTILLLVWAYDAELDRKSTLRCVKGNKS